MWLLSTVDRGSVPLLLLHAWAFKLQEITCYKSCLISVTHECTFIPQRRCRVSARS